MVESWVPAEELAQIRARGVENGHGPVFIAMHLAYREHRQFRRQWLAEHSVTRGRAQCEVWPLTPPVWAKADVR